MSDSDVVFDYGPEWIALTEEDRLKRSRVGAPITYRMHDLGIHSLIGTRVTKLGYLYAKVLRQGNERLIDTLREINQECKDSKVPDNVCEDAARYAKILWRNSATRGIVYRYNKQRLAKILIYIASIVNGALYQVDPETRRLAFRLSTYMNRLGRTFPTLHTKLVLNKIARYAENPQHEKLATQLFHVYRDRVIGRTSDGIAATFLYLAGKLLDLDITQYKIGKKLGITETALRYTLAAIRPKVEYYLVIDGKQMLVDTWWPGKDTYGLRKPEEIAKRYGISHYRFKIILPRNVEGSIKVIIVSSTL